MSHHPREHVEQRLPRASVQVPGLHAESLRAVHVAASGVAHKNHLARRAAQLGTQQTEDGWIRLGHADLEGQHVGIHARQQDAHGWTALGRQVRAHRKAQTRIAGLR